MVQGRGIGPGKASYGCAQNFGMLDLFCACVTVSLLVCGLLYCEESSLLLLFFPF